MHSLFLHPLISKFSINIYPSSSPSPQEKEKKLLKLHSKPKGSVRLREKEEKKDIITWIHVSQLICKTFPCERHSKGKDGLEKFLLQTFSSPNSVLSLDFLLPLWAAPPNNSLQAPLLPFVSTHWGFCTKRFLAHFKHSPCTISNTPMTSVTT